MCDEAGSDAAFIYSPFGLFQRRRCSATVV